MGVRTLETGVWGAYYNVQINLSSLKDEEFRQQVTLCLFYDKGELYHKFQ